MQIKIISYNHTYIISSKSSNVILFVLDFNSDINCVEFSQSKEVSPIISKQKD